MKEKYEQLDDKLNTFMEMLENNKTKNHHKEQRSLDMSISSSSESESPPHDKTKGN